MTTFARKKRKLLVQFPDASGTRLTGYTHDMSFTGLFVIADQSPPVGQPLKLTLHLPSGKALELSGTVVRQATPPGAQGITATQRGFGFALGGYSEEYTNFVQTI